MRSVQSFFEPSELYAIPQYTFQREELTDDDACDEDPEFQEEIQQQKREEQDEALRLFSEKCWSITAVDIYKRLLERERNVDNTFAFNLIRPIGSVAGELIWPRSYDSSNELTFDENGVAFPLHERPSLSRILRRSRISSLNGNNAYKDSYNYNSFNNFS
ncbi:unnamed protein product [Heligmosomoides polygyrus]|uniref:Bestrophin homolog n=1 Tax=Heligmosomoides polygyrus TaxID=6339 RepID=A0A3P7YBV5_HELPZ|nr:unnamed protein product [Heligmosomoides polygyrus]